MTDAGTVLLIQGGMPVPVPVSSLSVPLQMDVLAARLAASEAAGVLLAQRVAALEGKPDPCVALAGALPVATLQAGVGSIDVPVPVPGLLCTDRVAVELLADVPGGLALGAMRPDPKTPGVLLVQATATLSLTGKAAVPLAVTALR